MLNQPKTTDNVDRLENCTDSRRKYWESRWMIESHFAIEGSVFVKCIVSGRFYLVIGAVEKVYSMNHGKKRRKTRVNV